MQLHQQHQIQLVNSITRSEDQTPQQTLENAAETSTPPSQLNINEWKKL